MNTLPTLSGCSACGTSQVNHRLAHVLNLFDEVVSKGTAKFSEFIRIPYEHTLSNILSGLIINVFSVIGIARFSTDRTKAKSGRSELIWNEAIECGIPMEQIVVGGRYLEQYRARLNNRWYYFQSIPIPPWLPQKGYAWMDDKLALAHTLEAAYIPVPKARVATSWSDTIRAFETLTKPVIIKPRFGSRGRHTTTHINTLEELRTAYKLAKEIARELVIEEHLFGSVCRATTINGKLVGFFCADPPRIHGDGIRTVSELISAKNTQKHERLGSVGITDDLIANIARRGYTLDRVLPRGASLDLSAKTGRFYGGHTKEILPEVHPNMHTVFEKVASLVEAPVMGFDLIIENPHHNPETERWGIIECNSLPFIDLHYFALEGKPINIAKHIWDLWK